MYNPNDPHPQPTIRRHGLRPPSVDVALQHTPLTSIAPFDPDILPFPTPRSVRSTSDILNDVEKKESHRLLQDLDAAASSAKSSSSQLQRTLEGVRKILNPEEATRLRFKTPSLLQHTRASSQKSITKTQKRPLPRLGDFANLLLKSIDVPYRYSNQPSATSVRDKAPSKKSAAVAGPSHHSDLNNRPYVINAQAVEHNLNAAIGNGYLPVSSDDVNRQATANGPVVSIGGLPSSSDLSQYQAFPELDAMILQEERLLSEQNEQAVIRKQGQQERADQYLAELTDLIDDIFVSEDNLEHDTSEKSSLETSPFFTPVTINGREAFLLKSEIQGRLDNAMYKTISFGRFNAIAVDYLSRLQKISSVSLKRLAELDLGLPSDASDSAVEVWNHGLDLSADALQASRSILRMMAARPDEKQISSEEVVIDILHALKNVLEGCIIPAAEITDARSGSDRVQAIEGSQKRLIGVARRCGRALKSLGDLILATELSEGAVAIIESISLKLVFVENASIDKDAVLSLQTFQSLRQDAMDAVAKIFLRCPGQRHGIFNEILSSLEKLPVTRQSARQFKVIDGKPMQLVSALIMQLVQTSSTYAETPRSSQERIPSEDAEGSTDESDDEDISRPSYSKTRNVASSSRSSAKDPLERLKNEAVPLFETAQKNATYVAKHLVERALSSTKSGDQPYRNLLDIFVEDFIGVLSSTDWPAAEMLLASLLSHLIALIENEKSPAPAKTMALDVMGVMGSGIADLQNSVRHRLRKNEAEDQSLANLTENVLAGTVHDGQVLALTGPFREVVEYLQYRARKDELQLQSAISCYLVQWARMIKVSSDNARARPEADDDDDAESQVAVYEEAAHWLISAIRNDDDADDYILDTISTTRGRLCYAVTILTMPFGKALRRILHILMNSLSSPQPTIRSRGLKSVVQLVEKDASMLELNINILGHISSRLSDQSPLVRESAMAFVAKVPILKPSLEGEACRALISISSDESVALRKRAIKNLKDFYLRNKEQSLRSEIADAMIQRIADHEESVRDLARQTVEEIWFVPFYGYGEISSKLAQERQDLQRHAFLIVATAQRNDSVLAVLESLFRGAMAESAKGHVLTASVCKTLVAIMFEAIIDNDSTSGAPDQQSIFRCLTIFAKAQPSLFTTEQIKTLEPYILNLSSHDNFLIYRSVIVIFRRVLPVLPNLPEKFLSRVQGTLLQTVTRLGKLELNEVAMCLWIIDGVLKNTDRLVRLTLSTMKHVYDARSHDFQNPQLLAKVRRLITLLGYFGKACDLESQIDSYRKAFASLEVKSVSGLMVDLLCQFTDKARPFQMRQTALESVCLICQAWPKNFLHARVRDIFESIFKSRSNELEHTVLLGFRSFYDLEEQRTLDSGESSNGVNVNGLDRLGNSMTVGDNVRASTLIAEQFLDYILRISTDSYDDLAMLATEIIVSINRQGLIHPRKCGPTLVALSTSPNMKIAEIAAAENLNLHNKNESILEKQYLVAIERAYDYQKDTVHDTSGIRNDSSTPKLKEFFNAMKTGSIQSRKKLFANLCTRLNVDMARLPDLTTLISRLQYAGFVLSNLSLIEYGRVDELLHLTTCIEKAFLSTSTVLGQQIESRLGISTSSTHMDQAAQLVSQPVEPQTIGTSQLRTDDDDDEVSLLQKFTIIAKIMTIFWETRAYLRRTWSLQKYRGTTSSGIKHATKDLAKNPIRLPSADPQKLITRFSEVLKPLEMAESMRAQCLEFVELLAVDNELRASSDNDDQDLDGYGTPSDGDDERGLQAANGSTRDLKRKSSMSATSTPKKSKKKNTPYTSDLSRNGRNMVDEGEDSGWD